MHPNYSKTTPHFHLLLLVFFSPPFPRTQVPRSSGLNESGGDKDPDLEAGEAEKNQGERERKVRD